MEENNKNNGTRLFYITFAVIITVVAILIVTAAVAKKPTTTPLPDSTDNTTVQPNPDTPTDSNTDTLPTFSLPVNGAIGFDYSDSVPVFSQTMGDYRTHLGVDVSASLGTDVLAVADGTVTNIWDDPFMGKCISIQHSGNAVSVYKNLSPEIKEGIVIGCAVKSGDVIGAVGETAMNEIAEEPHLHFELKVSDENVDPKNHITFPTVDKNYEDEKAE